MLLADTSVWVDHLRKGEPLLAQKLNDDLVATHPYIIGEIALGSLKNRDTVLSLLRNLPQTLIATDTEVQGMIDQRRLYGRGIGYIDAHLLASASLSHDTLIWTRNKRLGKVAKHMKIEFIEE